MRCTIFSSRLDTAATAVLTSAGEPGEVVAALRSLPGDTGRLASAYVDRVAWRPVNGEDKRQACRVQADGLQDDDQHDDPRPGHRRRAD